MERATSLLPQYWYIVGESLELTGDKVLSRTILNEAVVCYRNRQGQVVAIQDRCIHRCVPLSCGAVKNGELTCAYHGWVYGEKGRVVSIPSEDKNSKIPIGRLHAKTFQVLEQDGYIYVCLQPGLLTPPRPRLLSQLNIPSRGRIRLKNRFRNSMANCVENYIDVPHTAYVHLGVFRKPKAQPLHTTVSREDGSIHITYHGETLNLGYFSWFLNPQGKEITHTDHFYAPCTTSVHYYLPGGYRYSITSHAVPVQDMETLVYTDIGYDFGVWTPFSASLVRHQAQTVIDQDIDILDRQGQNIEKYGEKFYCTGADKIHTLTREIIEALKNGTPPSNLSAETVEVTFCV